MENNKLNNRRSKNKFRRSKRERPEFDQKMIDLARVTRVVKGGRRFSFRATVVIGNRKGKVSYGVAKGMDVSSAIGKAVAAAKKRMREIKRTNTTIAFEVNKKLGAAVIMIKPAKEGRGIVAGGAMRSVLELAGIKDVVGKSFGTSNKINVARATIAALEDLGKPMAQQGRVKKETKQPQPKSIIKKTTKKVEQPTVKKAAIEEKKTEEKVEKVVNKE
ncbi:MAG TPA: 30S ribosomal protein S5 [Candidatus Moranbacteria bacterium]|nr:30S ribosomal protein S5 [Candidatus Moranbacteria bacterium]